MAEDVDVILCDIITEELDLDPTRVVVYAENWKAPEDEALYVVVSTRPKKPLSVTKRFDTTTNEEVKRVVTFGKFDIDITSKNREAIDRQEEILTALCSDYSLKKQYENNIKIFFQVGDILDLSFIEGASALKRFRIPVVVSNIKEKRKVIEYYNKTKIQEEVNE